MRSNQVFEFSLSPLIFDDDCFYDSAAAESAAADSLAVAVAFCCYCFLLLLLFVNVAVNLVIFLVEGPWACGLACTRGNPEENP